MTPKHLKIFDAEIINSWNPCYPAEKHLKPGEKYNVLKLLDRKDIPFDDRLWVILRDDLVSEKLMRLFAVWCARQVQHLMKDERSIKALDVAEKFANGEATEEERAAARAAAWDAGRDAAWDAARDAARAAAGAAARETAWDAGRDAAWDAARDAARAAAGAAARDAAWDAAWDAGRDAAWDAAWGAAWAAARAAAWAAARDAQEAKLREMLIAGIETGDVL